MIQLLFVCQGNICRSPAAEAIMNQLLEEHQLDHQITCDSAGLTTTFLDKRPDERMIEVAEEHGYQMNSLSRQISPTDIESADFILAMNNEILAELRLITAHQPDAEKIHLLGDFCEFHPDTQIPDPYAGEKDDFDYVMDMLEDACHGLLTMLKNRIN